MSRKSVWSTERKWETNIVERRFEKLLVENGFTVIGIKEFMTKTDYLIAKDGYECEFTIFHVENRTKKQFDNFVAAYEIKVEYEKLKEEVAKCL